MSSPSRWFRHSADRAVASNSAAALAASNVSAVPPMTRSLSPPPPFFVLRRTSHVGTTLRKDQQRETSNIGRNRRARREWRQRLPENVGHMFALTPHRCSVPIGALIVIADNAEPLDLRPAGRDCLSARVTRTVDAPQCKAQ